MNLKWQRPRWLKVREKVGGERFVNAKTLLPGIFQKLNLKKKKKEHNLYFLLDIFHKAEVSFT